MTLQEGLRSGDRATAAALPLSLAADRPGRTPLLPLPSPAPLTFQDFLKEADLQFLDAMRRGTSLNLADLASDPPPQTLQASSCQPGPGPLSHGPCSGESSRDQRLHAGNRRAMLWRA